MNTSDSLVSTLPSVPYRRIATEEAFVTKELLSIYRKLLHEGGNPDPGFKSLMGYFLLNPTSRARNVAERLGNLTQRRIDDMDAAGISMQILALTCPGVQIFDAATATSLATAINDEMLAAIAKNPIRFAGLAAVAPQDPASAAKEIERCVKGLFIGLDQMRL